MLNTTKIKFGKVEIDGGGGTQNWKKKVPPRVEGVLLKKWGPFFGIVPPIKGRSISLKKNKVGGGPSRVLFSTRPPLREPLHPCWQRFVPPLRGGQNKKKTLPPPFWATPKWVLLKGEKNPHGGVLQQRKRVNFYGPSFCFKNTKKMEQKKRSPPPMVPFGGKRGLGIWGKKN